MNGASWLMPNTRYDAASSTSQMGDDVAEQNPCGVVPHTP